MSIYANRPGGPVVRLFFAALVWAALAPPAVWADDDDDDDDDRGVSQSSTIALSRSGSLLFNINHEANSVTVFRVDDDDDDLRKLDEIPVGREPSCVAVAGDEAFVTNAGSGTVSVIDRSDGRFRVVREIPVGPEPRGCALS